MKRISKNFVTSHGDLLSQCFKIIAVLAVVVFFGYGASAWADDASGVKIAGSSVASKEHDTKLTTQLTTQVSTDVPTEVHTESETNHAEKKQKAKALVGASSKDPLAGYMAGESIFPSFFKIIMALIAVIAGIYLTLTLLKKAMGRKVSSGNRTNAIEVIETCYLAPKRSISLVRIGSRGALLSVSDNTIATLMELSSDETSEIVEMVESGGSAPDFRKTLSKAKQKIIDLGSYAKKHRDDSQVRPAQTESVGVK
jgi:flagellar biogenesis protein FliO